MAIVIRDDLGEFILQTWLRECDEFIITGEVESEGRVAAEMRGWGMRKRAALQAITEQVTVMDHSWQPIKDAYVKLDIASRRLGRHMTKNDLWIAAATHALGALLITCDGDFDHLRKADLIRVARVPRDSRLAKVARE